MLRFEAVFYYKLYLCICDHLFFFFFFQAEDGIRDDLVTGVQTCALPISDRLGAPALARQPAADDELLAVHRLDLYPAGGAPAGLVGGVESLGDDSLEALLDAPLEQLGAVADDVLGRLPARAVERELGEAGAAVGGGGGPPTVCAPPQPGQGPLTGRRGVLAAARPRPRRGGPSG